MKKLTLILFTITLCFILISCTKNTPEQKPLNTETALNTSGNIKNGGYLCSNSRDIFYSNPNDEKKLYTVPLKGGDSKKLLDESVGYLNYIKGNLYFSTPNGVFSLNLFTNEKTTLLSNEDFNSEPIGLNRYYHIKDNYIYFFKDIPQSAEERTPFYYPKELLKIPLTGGEKEKVFSTNSSLDFYDPTTLVFSDRYSLGTVNENYEYTNLAGNLWNVNVVGVTDKFIYADSIHIGENDGSGILKIDKKTGQYVKLFNSEVLFLLSINDKVYISIDGQELLSYSDNGEITRYENISEPITALYQLGDDIVYISKSGEIKSIASGNSSSSTILTKYMDFSQYYFKTFLTNENYLYYNYTGALLLNNIPYIVISDDYGSSYVYDFSSGTFLFPYEGIVYNHLGYPINSSSNLDIPLASKDPLIESGNDAYKTEAKSLNNTDGYYLLSKALESINNSGNYSIFYINYPDDFSVNLAKNLTKITDREYYTFSSVGDVYGQSIPLVDKYDGTVYRVCPSEVISPNASYYDVFIVNTYGKMEKLYTIKSDL